MSEELVEPQKDAILAHHNEIPPATESEQGSEINTFALPNGLLVPVEADNGALIAQGASSAAVAIGTAVDEETGEAIPQYDLNAYRWQQNGRKISKITDKNEIIRRQHWRCSHWDKPTKDKGCKAKYRIDIYQNGKPASEPFKNDIPHNHLPPPEKGRVDIDMQLQMAVSPMKREKKVRKATTPPPPAKEDGESFENDAKRQCVDSAAAVKEHFEQQVIAIQSVIRLFESYGDNFTRKVDLYPDIRAIFASPKGLEELIKHSETVYVSSDYIALGLTLVIFSVVANAEESAVLWLISNGNDAPNYELMLRYVHDDMAEGRFKPSNLVLGGHIQQATVDGAFRDAFSRVFPNCRILLSVGQSENATTSTAVPDATLAAVPVHPHSVIASTILSSFERPNPQ